MQKPCPKLHLLRQVTAVGLIASSLTLASFYQPKTGWAQAVGADNSLVLVAIPPRLGDDGLLKAKPGERIDATVKVRNNSDKTVTVGSIVRDFILAEDGQTPLVIEEPVSSRWSLASWVTLAPSSSVLAPNQTAVLSMVIEVPEDALPGGHYAMVLHEPQTEVVRGEETTDTTKSISAVNPRVGTLLYLTVDGPINEQAFLRNLSFPRFSEYGPVAYNFSVENLSDVHIKPGLSLEIRNLFGKVVERKPLDTKNVFPLTTRHFTGQWDRIWGLGYYNARLVMNYGTGGQVASLATGFWLFPITLVLAIIVGLLTLIALIIAVRRHLVYRQKQQAERIKELESRVEELEK